MVQLLVLLRSVYYSFTRGIVCAVYCTAYCFLLLTDVLEFVSALERSLRYRYPCQKFFFFCSGSTTRSLFKQNEIKTEQTGHVPPFPSIYPRCHGCPDHHIDVKCTIAQPFFTRMICSPTATYILHVHISRTSCPTHDIVSHVRPVRPTI